MGKLYNNYDGLLDKFAAFWGLVAKTFADRDAVFGYELMNEPWCGDIFEDPTLLFPGVADRRYLEPMYDKISAEVRKYDDEHIILFAAVTWEVTGIGEAIGFTHPPGGFDYSNRLRQKELKDFSVISFRSVLAFHNSVQTQIGSHEQVYDWKWQEIQRLGLAGFVTETGGCCLDLADEITKWGYSWVHWAYKLYGAWTGDSHGHFSLVDDNNYDCPSLESCLNVDSLWQYARVFPSAIAGTGKYFTFSVDTSEALLVFQPDPDIELPTELRVPVRWRYQAGVQIDIVPPGLAHWRFGSVSDGLSEEEANSTVLITLSEAWSGEELSVTVVPAK